jgi:hypothetical protein
MWWLCIPAARAALYNPSPILENTMTIKPRDWANHHIDDFSFSFLDADQNEIHIEVYLKQPVGSSDRYIGKLYCSRSNQNLNIAIPVAVAQAKALVTLYIQTALRLRESEIGADWSVFEESEA